LGCVSFHSLAWLSVCHRVVTGVGQRLTLGASCSSSGVCLGPFHPNQAFPTWETYFRVGVLRQGGRQGLDGFHVGGTIMGSPEIWPQLLF
jgi:hypothetical protein